MNNYVADTMAIVLYLEKRKLPGKVKEIFRDAITGTSLIYISAVSLMEIGYLAERLRIEATIHSVLNLVNENQCFLIYDLDPKTVTEGFKIKDIPELHDRLIAAAAAILQAALITNDPVIRESKYIETIW